MTEERRPGRPGRPRRAWGGMPPPPELSPASQTESDAREPLLPSVTEDETDRGWGEDSRPDAGNDERLRREVPPHW